MTREDYLEQTIRMAEEELSGLPKGRIRYHQGTMWYYRGPKKEKKNLPVDDPLVRQLVRRAYLEKVIRAAKQELNARTRYRRNQPQLKMEEVYDQLSEPRQQLIRPLIPTPQQVIDSWVNQPYPSRNPIPIDNKFPTGVPSCPYVRSKSELLEVQGMSAAKMAFLYEFPLVLKDANGKEKTVYPDFTIYNRKTHGVLYWEHFGRMDDAGYLADFKNKQELYARNGILGSRLYQTFEFSSRPLTMVEIQAIIEDIRKIAGW